MATILLTGATGYIASHTWLALQAAGYSVVGVDEVMTLTGDMLASENRRELLMPFYSFVLLLFLGVVAAFQMPLVVVLLGWVGLASAEWLRKQPGLFRVDLEDKAFGYNFGDWYGLETDGGSIVDDADDTTTDITAAALITLTATVTDGGGLSASRTFTIAVTDVNDAPTLAPLAALDLTEDAPEQTVALTGIGTGAINEAQVLTVSAASNVSNGPRRANTSGRVSASAENNIPASTARRGRSRPRCGAGGGRACRRDRA